MPCSLQHAGAPLLVKRVVQEVEVAEGAGGEEGGAVHLGGKDTFYHISKNKTTQKDKFNSKNYAKLTFTTLAVCGSRAHVSHFLSPRKKFFLKKNIINCLLSFKKPG